MFFSFPFSFDETPFLPKSVSIFQMDDLQYQDRFQIGSSYITWWLNEILEYQKNYQKNFQKNFQPVSLDPDPNPVSLLPTYFEIKYSCFKELEYLFGRHWMIRNLVIARQKQWVREDDDFNDYIDYRKVPEKEVPVGLYKIISEYGIFIIRIPEYPILSDIYFVKDKADSKCSPEVEELISLSETFQDETDQTDDTDQTDQTDKYKHA